MPNPFISLNHNHSGEAANGERSSSYVQAASQGRFRMAEKLQR